MPRGQTPTPTERAQAELDKAREDLAKFADRAQKKIDAAKAAKERYLALQAEVDALKPEYDYEKDRVALLSKHPLLGGAGVAPAPVHEVEQAKPDLRVVGENRPVGPADEDARDVVTSTAKANQIVTRVAQPKQQRPVEKAQSAPEPRSAYEPTPRDPNKVPPSGTPDFDLAPEETLGDTVLPDDPDDVSPMTDGDGEPEPPTFDFDPFAEVGGQRNATDETVRPPAAPASDDPPFVL